jgi:hypothetical protein
LPAGEETAQLEFMVTLGLLDREFSQRVHLWHNCGHHALNFSESCPSCSSAHVDLGDLSHHLRCGHTAPEFAFQEGIRYACPICAHQLRHIGVVYERPARSCFCRSFSFAFVEPRTRCHCLGCGERFDVERAVGRDVFISTVGWDRGGADARVKLGLPGGGPKYCVTPCA